MDGHIGGRLRQRRSLLGITQEQLAESVGITFQQIQKYENGVNRISAGRLFEFSEILDVPVSFFFENFAGGKKKSYQALGLAEGDQAPFEGEEDILKRKETLQLIRVYYSIRNPKLRKDLFNLVKSMADNMRDQDGES
ncbi:MAG: helix-turn-helix transcriptional regulator [Rhodospirillales bacterium]|nr:helix-turn-helix transcriptional regulator [Alphaproteobacteria bacterium]USO04635.1 MAG: helix-turn-helix transcriptional regulator [Rhodospirillales bacterium]